MCPVWRDRRRQQTKFPLRKRRGDRAATSLVVVFHFAAVGGFSAKVIPNIREAARSKNN